MNKKRLVLLFVLCWGITGCFPQITTSAPTSVAVMVPKAESSPTPLPPTPTLVPQPRLIQPDNVNQLQPYQQTTLNSPARLIWALDGKSLGTVTLNGLWLLRAEDLSPLSRVEVQSPITILDYSPTANLMATAADQQNLELRQITTGQAIHVITPQGGFMGASFSSDGRLLITSSASEIAAVLWDTASGQSIKTLSGFETGAPVYGVTFAGSGNWLIWVARATVQVMDITSGVLSPAFEHEDFVGAAALSPDGKLLATTAAGTQHGGFMPFLFVWDTASGDQLGVLPAGDSVPTVLAFSPDGSLLAAQDGKKIMLWDVAARQLAGGLSGHEDMVTSLAWSPDGTTLASASVDGLIRLWQVR